RSAGQYLDQLVLLRDEADPRLRALREMHAVLAEYLRAAGRRRAEAEQHLEQRRLAGAVLAEHADHVAGLGGCSDPAQHLFVSERLAKFFGADDRFAHLRSPSARR